MRITDYLMWQLADAHLKLLSLQREKHIKSLSNDEYTDRMYGVVMPVARHFIRIIRESGLPNKIMMDISNGKGSKKYARARVYNTPNKMHGVLKRINDLYDSSVNGDLKIRAESMVLLMDAITDSIHGSSYIDLEIAKAEPIRNLEDDVTVISYMAQSIADQSPKWAQERLLMHIRNNPRALV